MRIAVVSLVAIVAVSGLGYLLGWLKVFYYYQAFGVELSLLGLSPLDYVRESWFVGQNVLFFVLLWWVVFKSRVIWAGAIGIVHAFLPIAGHYAFLWHESPLAWWVIDLRHTLLKLIPFAVLAAVWLAYPRHRKTLRDLSPPLTKSGLALFTILGLAWAVSAAKHFGSYDANRAMARTDEHLTRVQIDPRDASALLERLSGRELYLLHATSEDVILWDRTGFEYADSRSVRILSLSRATVELLEGEKAFRIQPGKQFL